MTTIFSLLSQTCGLSHREAAEWLGVRLDTVKSWSAGRNGTPDRVINNLVDLAAKIDIAANEAIDCIDEVASSCGERRTIEIGLSSDDAEAQSLGWPCVGAHKAVSGLIVSRGMAAGYTFKIVPRGTTPATAAAADIHDRHRSKPT